MFGYEEALQDKIEDLERERKKLLDIAEAAKRFVLFYNEYHSESYLTEEIDLVYEIEKAILEYNRRD